MIFFKVNIKTKIEYCKLSLQRGLPIIILFLNCSTRNKDASEFNKIGFAILISGPLRHNTKFHVYSEDLKDIDNYATGHDGIFGDMWPNGMKYLCYYDSANTNNFKIDYSKPVFYCYDTTNFVRGKIIKLKTNSSFVFPIKGCYIKYFIKDIKYHLSQEMSFESEYENKLLEGDSVEIEYMVSNPKISRVRLNYPKYSLKYLR